MVCSALLHRMDGQACVMAADFGQLQDTCRSMSFQPPKKQLNTLQLLAAHEIQQPSLVKCLLASPGWIRLCDE
jgi:hypothetical protein